MITTSLAVSILIFVAIAARQWLPAAVRIWHIMVAGAAVLLALGEIAPEAALRAVDWNVIAYLFGVFSIAAALYDSGISHRLGARLGRAGGAPAALAAYLAAMAACAAVLTNDAAAVIGTPIALMLARAFRWPPALPLAALCAAVTIGSMATPVGNPQNILIATRGPVAAPVATFALWLGPPAAASLAFAWLWFRRLLARAGEAPEATDGLPLPHDMPRAWTAWLATALLVLLIGGDSVAQALGRPAAIPFGAASLVACAPIYLFGNRRRRILAEVDWATLAFFVAMFVVTRALLASGALQAILGPLQARLDEPAMAAAIGFWASQLFSNVPLVELYLRLMAGAPVATLLMLAGISTLAGNLFIISAASNVIVVQQAERFGPTPFGFWRFAGLMLPVTIVSVAVTLGWVAALAALL